MELGIDTLHDVSAIGVQSLDLNWALYLTLSLIHLEQLLRGGALGLILISIFAKTV